MRQQTLYLTSKTAVAYPRAQTQLSPRDPKRPRRGKPEA